MLFKKYQVIILAAVFLLQFMFEHIYPQNKLLNKRKNEGYNILMALLNYGIIFFPATGLVWILSFIEEKNIGLMQNTHFAPWLEFPLTILVLDIWMYAWHRMNHIIPFLWKFHRFHHRDMLMNTTTAIRFHFAELLFSYPGKILVCMIVGISYPALLVYEILFFTAIVIHHSNIFITETVDKIYRILFSSPGMHRIHHSIFETERNSNYGSVFSFWDRIFGTVMIKDFSNIKFGIEENTKKNTAQN